MTATWTERERESSDFSSCGHDHQQSHSGTEDDDHGDDEESSFQKVALTLINDKCKKEEKEGRERRRRRNQLERSTFPVNGARSERKASSDDFIG